jgi:hypothetical protein
MIFARLFGALSSLKTSQVTTLALEQRKEAWK